MEHPHHHLSLNHKDPWGIAAFTTSFLHFSLFSTACWDLANSRPTHSLMLSSHLFCLPCLLPPFLCLAKWFWPDLINGRHVHTTAVCVKWDDTVVKKNHKKKHLGLRMGSNATTGQYTVHHRRTNCFIMVAISSLGLSSSSSYWVTTVIKLIILSLWCMLGMFVLP